MLDRTEIRPICSFRHDFSHALKQVTKMMRNRGFDTIGESKLVASETPGFTLCDTGIPLFLRLMFPFAKQQFPARVTQIAECGLYRSCLKAISHIEEVLLPPSFATWYWKIRVISPARFVKKITLMSLRL